MRQTRTVAALERRRRDYKRKLLALSKEIRARKRGLRMLVNRKAFVNGEVEFEVEFDSAANEKGGGSGAGASSPASRMTSSAALPMWELPITNHAIGSKAASSSASNEASSACPRRTNDRERTVEQVM